MSKDASTRSARSSGNSREQAMGNRRTRMDRREKTKRQSTEL